MKLGIKLGLLVGLLFTFSFQANASRYDQTPRHNSKKAIQHEKDATTTYNDKSNTITVSPTVRQSMIETYRQKIDTPFSNKLADIAEPTNPFNVGAAAVDKVVNFGVRFMKLPEVIAAGSASFGPKLKMKFMKKFDEWKIAAEGYGAKHVMDCGGK